MGTTRDHLRNDPQIEIGWTLIIEGYPWILSDCSPAQAIAAWAGTQWTQAMTGLSITSTFKQGFDPWSNELPVSGLTFNVQPDNTSDGQGSNPLADQFGIDVFKTKPTAKSELVTGFDTATSKAGSFNISVQQADQFSTGVVYVGNEAFNITSPSGTTLPVDSNGSGVYSPFGTNTTSANTFPGPHNLSPDNNANDYNSMAPVHAADIPTSWLGRKVAVYCHRKVAGTLDLKAQAELIFAGTIESVTDKGIEGTQVDCAGIQQQVLDSVIMEQQWAAEIEPGYKFTVGQAYRIEVTRQAITGGTPTTKEHDLTVVASASDTDEITAGRYTLYETASMIQAWLQDSDVLGQGGPGTPWNLDWSAYVNDETNGSKFTIKLYHGTTAIWYIRFGATNTSMMEFLGFSYPDEADKDGYFFTKKVQSKDPNRAWVEGDEVPYEYPPLNRFMEDREHYFPSIELRTSVGTFIDHTSSLPPSAQESIGAGEEWSFFSIGNDVLFLAERESATSLVNIRMGVGIAKLSSTDQRYVYEGARVGEKKPVVKQIFYSTDTFTNQVTKLLASIDGNGVNHATYDTLDFGGAGISWDLLGDNWLNSCKSLEQSSAEDSMVLVIEKPTRVWDLIKSDFMVRMATIVWSDGGLKCAQLQVPNAEAADATIDETSKIDSRLTSSSQFDSWLCNTLKLEYNRDPIADEYRDVALVRDLVGYEAMGQLGKTKTIQLRNTHGSEINSGASVEALGEMLTARFMPVLARPLRVFRTSVNHNLWHLHPGMTVSFSDDFVRDPTTGKRGLTSRACTVIETAFQYGVSSNGQSYTGEVTLLYTEEDRAFSMGWACMQDEDYAGGSFTNGVWDDTGTSGYYYVAVEAQEYSSGADNDIDWATVGDAVRVTEVDPADPATGDSFSDTIGDIISSPTYAIGLDNGFGAGGRPAFSASKLYRITPDKYSVVVAGGNADAQVLDTFMGDSGDGFIQDAIEPNVYSDNQVLDGFTAAVATALPARHNSASYDEGASFHAGLMQDLARMANNLNNYKTAPAMPLLTWNASGYSDGLVSTSVGGATVGQLMTWFPFYIGENRFPGSRTRKLYVQPIIGHDTASTATFYVVTSQYPPVPTLYDSGGSGSLNDPVFRGAKKTLTFTSTSNTGSSPKTWGYPTVQSVTPVRCPNATEITYITVYAATGANQRFLGFSQLWMGPYE